MKTRISTVLGAGALVLLAACGGDEGPNWTDEITTEGAEGMAELAAGVADEVSQNLLFFSYTELELEGPAAVAGTTTPTAAELFIARLRARAYRGTPYEYMAATPSPFRVSAVCVPVETGVDSLGAPIDTDEDGIPNDYTISFPSGCTETDGDLTYTWSGSARVRDVAGLFGYRLDVNNLRLRVSYPEGYEQMGYDGTEQGLYAAGGITHSSDLTIALAAHSSGPIGAGLQSAAATDVAISYRQIESSSYDPDGTITLEAVGDGLLTFDLDYRFVFAYSDDTESLEEAVRFTMVTTSALDIDDACPGPIDGTIVGDLNGNADIGFTINWSACNTYEVTTRGTTAGIEPPAVGVGGQ
jgi:hypothetical protein